MSVSFLDGAVIQKIRNDILKLNLGVTFDASQIGEGQSVFTDRGKFASVNQLKPNVIDEPRVLDLQEPLSISLLRKNKYASSEDGYRLVSIEENPREFLSNETKTEYDELVQPYIGIPISEGGSRIVDIKTLILNGRISEYKDTPLGMIGIRELDKLLKENIASNIQSSTVGRFNNDPISLLKGNSLITPNRTITSISNPSNPVEFLKAGVNLTNEYLGYTNPVSIIPNAAIGWQEINKGRGYRKKNDKENSDSKFANFLNGVNDATTSVKNSIEKTLSILGVGNPYDLSTESRMEVLLRYTGDGQKEAIFNNLSNNIFQPGYEYQQSLLKLKKLDNFQANTIQNNIINRGQDGVYGLLNNVERYKKFGYKGAYNTADNDERSVLKKNGLVRVAPDKENKDMKNYMFSIENLAWADVPDTSIAQSELGIGDPATGYKVRGRMMWFPPYDLKVDESNSASWSEEDFLGRPEPVFTYNNSSRSGSLSFKVLVDHPSIVNVVRGSQSDVLEKYFKGEINISDLPNYTNIGRNEDDRRNTIKKLLGNTKRGKFFKNKPKTDSPAQSDTNEPENSSVIPVTNNTLIPGQENIVTSSSFFSDSESNWFSELKVTDPLVNKYLSEKIQYFHPAFHSTSPEGFNSRLTFLQQCLRQGPSITEGGKATGNLAFGRPPVCILRIGDFYNTKVVFDSMNISYDDSPWDLNPDGIGVQPMIANITMQFKFIGGSSLTGPINKLQNAVSFNFFANTEIYDVRSNFWDKTNGEDVLKKGMVTNEISKDQTANANQGASLKTEPNVNQVESQDAALASSAGNNLLKLNG